MSTVSPILLASTTLLGLSLMAASGSALAAETLPEGVQVAYCSQSLNTLSLSPSIDVTTIAKVKFFITPDNGKTWVLGQETLQPPISHDRPRFPFKVDHDGVYGVMTCVTYRDGRAELEPHAGQSPQYALVIDSTPPSISRFDASLVGATANRTVVHCSWSTSDANPAAEPVVLEASTDGGAHFTIVKRGQGEGTSELTVPIDALTKQLLLRLVATDRAGNSTTSPVRTIPVTTPAAVQVAATPTNTVPAPPVAPAPAAPIPAVGTPATPGTTAAAPGTPSAPITPSSPATPVVPTATAAPATPVAPAAAPANPATDAVSEFAQATKGLPSLSDIGVTTPTRLPEIAPVAQDRHSPGTVGTNTAATAQSDTTAPPVPSATLPQQPPADVHQDVIVAGTAPDAPLAGSNAVDHEFFAGVAPARIPTQPRQDRRPITSSASNDGTVEGAGHQTGRTSEPPHATQSTGTDPAPALVRRAPAPPPQPARPVAPPAPISDDGQHPAPVTAPFVPDEPALHAIGMARVSVSVGRTDEALTLYERLFASSQARQAAAEELQVLNTLKRPLDVVTVVQALPRELMTDAVRLEQSRALMTLAHYDQAFASLSHIASRAPESREALMLMAVCYRALGQDAEARKVLEFLARGSDRFASDAAAQLGHPAR